MSLFLIGVLTLISSIIGTVTGFGTSTIMVPVLLNFMPLPQTLLLVGIIHWFGNVWKMLFFKSGIDWKLILGFGVPGIFAGVLGGWLSQMVDTVILIRFIGFFLLAYVAFLMFEPSFKLPKKMGTSIAGGLSSGFLAGLTGVGGAIRSSFLSAFDLPKAKFIFTAGAIGFFIDSSRVAGYIIGGATIEFWLWQGLLIFLPVS
ncbi:MAG TPA: sulfite exporter TauE/SafE family protein, partial [Candidatus Gracilibacteria bacterium]|nr:sulfite exporter TauE/SafE family protein [Candidatus Gracilibacteria bacterium]